MKNHGEIILYQSEDSIQFEVRIEDETVWLTQAQIAELFGTLRQAINWCFAQRLGKEMVCIFQNGNGCKGID